MRDLILQLSKSSIYSTKPQASRNVALTINTEAPILSGLNVQSVRISSSVSIVDGDESIFVVRNTRFSSLCFRAFLRSL